MSASTHSEAKIFTKYGLLAASSVSLSDVFVAFSSRPSLHSLYLSLVGVNLLKPCTAEIQGTPTEQQWLGVTSLINWNSFPDWHPKDLASAFHSLSPQGVDLLTKLLKLNPTERISAKAALDHPYFDSLDKSF